MYGRKFRILNRIGYFKIKYLCIICFGLERIFVFNLKTFKFIHVFIKNLYFFSEIIKCVRVEQNKRVDEKMFSKLINVQVQISSCRWDFSSKINTRERIIGTLEQAPPNSKTEVTLTYILEVHWVSWTGVLFSYEFPRQFYI